MELLYQSKFFTLRYDATLALLEIVWLATSADMEDIDFQNTILEHMKALRQFSPQIVFSDLRQMGYVIAPEMQDWANEEVNAVALGVKKIAFVIAAELTPQLSVEQTMETVSATQSIAIEYFAKPAQALAWFQGASVKQARALAV
jgi:hypothetical protein